VKYHFKIHKETNGFWAECLEIKGCATQGDNMKELRHNMKEALDLAFMEPPDSVIFIPRANPKLKGANIVEVEADPSMAMANRIRELRLKNKLTQIAMKDRLGIKHLSSYQRLEDPERANPEWKTLLRIKRAFPKFKVDDLL
jgi:antitoxin HicB